MTKLLCSPIAKLLLFFGGFVAAVFVLRAINLTFDRAVAFAFDSDAMVQRPVHEGVFFGHGFLLFALLSFLCVGLLLLSVWTTKPKAQKETIFSLWRRLDFSLLAILAALITLATLYGLRIFYAEGHAIFHVQTYELLGLPFLAYTAAMLTITEFVARLRDKDLLRTLYWIRFFRLYPIWNPLGLLMSLLLIGSLIVLVATMQEIVQQATFIAIDTVVPTFSEFRDFREFSRAALVPPAVPTALLLPFSLLSLISTTYFVAFSLNLSDKYAKMSTEKIQAERFKSELITNVSHDIRTPLTSLINYVDLLSKLPLEGQAAEYTSILNQKSNRLKMLIDDLMEASKAGSGNVKITTQTVNLTEIVGQAAGEFEEQLRERNVTLVFHHPEDPVFVSTDNRHLWRVLENLFSNAAKYACPSTRVFATIGRSSGGRPIFTLKNTSETPLDLSGEALSEQFIRGDRARQSEGSGLGLYIAKSLAELMGTKFTIRTTGDLFEVELVFPAAEG